MAYDSKLGSHDSAPPLDNGAIVREAANLADRATKITVQGVTVVDPASGVQYTFPLVSDGRKIVEGIHDLAAKWKPAHHISGVAHVETLDSFIDLVNRHKNEHSVIFADLKGSTPSLRAVIDYHTTDHAPKFGRHSVLYKFPLSPEFNAWRGVSGKQLGQKDFAAWVEDHIHEIVEPSENEKKEFESALGLKFGSPHELVRVARGISIHADLKVANIQTLATGESQIAYEETHTLKDSDGKALKIPGLILVMVPLFYGGESVRLPFRLRYERKGPEVMFKFVAFRLDNILLATLESDYVTAVAETIIPGYRGAAEI